MKIIIDVNGRGIREIRSHYSDANVIHTCSFFDVHMSNAYGSNDSYFKSIDFSKEFKQWLDDNLIDCLINYEGIGHWTEFNEKRFAFLEIEKEEDYVQFLLSWNDELSNLTYFIGSIPADQYEQGALW